MSRTDDILDGLRIPFFDIVHERSAMKCDYCDKDAIGWCIDVREPKNSGDKSYREFESIPGSKKAYCADHAKKTKVFDSHGNLMEEIG